MKNNLNWKTYNGSVDISKIEEFEKKIGFNFPSSYKKIASKYDRACLINNDCFNYYSNFTEEEEIGSIGMFFGYGDPKDEFDEVETIDHKWKIIQQDRDFPFPENVVPFSRDGAGNYICFDYRRDHNTNNPPILFWFHEAESGSKGEISFIANSFDEFLDMLYDSRSEEFKNEIESYSILLDD